MERKIRGINLECGTSIKRLWFGVLNEKSTLNHFDSLCSDINNMDPNLDWKEFIHKVEQNFAQNGFYRIAR